MSAGGRDTKKRTEAWGARCRSLVGSPTTPPGGSTMKRVLTVTLLVLAALSLASSAPASTPGQLANGEPSAHAARKAPNVRCMRLDRAERKLRRLGFRTREHGRRPVGVIVQGGRGVASHIA